MRKTINVIPWHIIYYGIRSMSDLFVVWRGKPMSHSTRRNTRNFVYLFIFQFFRNLNYLIMILSIDIFYHIECDDIDTFLFDPSRLGDSFSRKTTAACSNSILLIFHHRFACAISILFAPRFYSYAIGLRHNDHSKNKWYRRAHTYAVHHRVRRVHTACR